MRDLWKVLTLLVAVAAIASLSCLTTSHIFHRDASHRPSDLHRWIHAQLNLTLDQDKALDTQEEQFTARKKTLVKEIQLANAELATAMQHDKTYSPQVVAAVEKIHYAQSSLEKATLEHIFGMKSVLTPEQFDKLLELTGNALNEPSGF